MTMSFTSQMRVSGYVAMTVVYVANGLYMMSYHTKEAMDDINVKRFVELQYRYLTCWNFLQLILYGIVGLTCETVAATNHVAVQKISKLLFRFRETFFSAVVFPFCFLVPSIFWPLFLYDRNLVLPAFVDKILPTISNHIIHTLIGLFALWEAIFRPRSAPESHKKNLILYTVYTIAYTVTLFYTYYEHGHWLYPIVGILYKTVYLPVLVVLVYGLGMSFYYLQWDITWLVWGSTKSSKRRKFN